MDDFGLFIIGLILTAIFAGLTFLFWWKIRKLKDLRTLRLGRLSFFYLICLWITLNGILGSVIVWSPHHNGIGLLLLVGEITVLGLGPVLIGLIVPIAIVILTIKMWRRESKSVGNLLLPIIVLFFALIDWLYLSVGRLSLDWVWLHVLSYVFPVLSIYLAWQFGIFFLSSWVYGRRVRKLSAVYFVVLGSGLVAGERVGVLLGNRIRAAVRVAKEDTILIFSGGQGPDEKISEAAAMQKFAVEELGFPIERTLTEEKSRTTYENLVFSDKLIDKQDLTEPSNHKFMFFTSDYHVFRAALFAARLKLTAQGGRGGKTAMYYRVPAFIREFIAVMNSERKKHIIWVGLIVGIFIIWAIVAELIYLKNGH